MKNDVRIPPITPPPPSTFVVQEQPAMVSQSTPRAVAVYCAASIGNKKVYAKAAMSLAEALVMNGRPLVYGGGNSGIMGVVSSAVAKRGGEVTGIIPYAIFAAGGEKDKGVSDDCTTPSTVSDVDEKQAADRIETIIVDSMHERKVEMAKRSGAFVGLPGGFGSFEEILEVITWNQINIHNKPVIILNVLSYYNPLRELIKNGIENGFIRPENERLVVFVDGPANHMEHEDFEWGRAALEAIDSWNYHRIRPLPFHWKKDVDSSDMTRIWAEMKSTVSTFGLNAKWFRNAWHVRSRSARV